MPTDILQNEPVNDTDLRLINSGDQYDPVFDIGYGESTDFHQRDILFGRHGEFRQSPSLGVGVADYLEDDSQDDMFAAIRREFAKDGIKIKTMNIIQVNDEAQLNIDANH